MGTACRLGSLVGIESLLSTLRQFGYRVVGPVVRDGVIVYDDLTSATDMPRGVTVEQGPGRWRLQQTDRPERFSWTPAADSWKRFVFPPRSEVLRIRRTDGSFVVTHPEPPDRPLALIGARDCEVRALAILDGVFLGGDHPDPRHRARRAGMFVVAVTCGVPSSTCWCTSMGGGPQPSGGFDLRLTEVDEAFLVEAGTDRGEEVLARLDGSPADAAVLAAAERVVQSALAQLPVRVDGAALPERLAGTDHHRQWADVAERCLSCGNCTSVCPTCFCSSFSDHTELGGDGDETVREQVWTSCFELDHSSLGGRPVRATISSRYRQWLTHKLQTWPEQFGTNGCVGCGRCTTWCPAGIDLAAEAIALTSVDTTR
ncbi:MAG: 4Fe-4S dicluster domain-containing protein [Acidimicrobiales bacterium]